MARRLAANSDLLVQFAQLAAQESPDFQDGIDAVRGDLHLLWGVEPARRSSRNAITRRASLTSRSCGCHETPPNGVEIPVSRFAISENFTAVFSLENEADSVYV